MTINKSDFDKPLSQVNKSIEAKKRKNRITDRKFEDAFINPIKKGYNKIQNKRKNNLDAGCDFISFQINFLNRESSSILSLIKQKYMAKTFKQKFELELEDKSINKEHIIKLLKITRPTLMSRLANPNTWTLGEVNKIDKKYKININQIV